MSESEYRSYEDDMIGLCTDCHAERECCEPDARNYTCEECGCSSVFGVPELLIMGQITFK